MPVDFEAIIRDDKAWPDTIEMDFNGQKIPLSVIRNLNKAQRKEIADALSGIQNEREAMARHQKEVTDLATQAKAMHDELQRQLNTANQQAETAQRVQQNGGYDPEQTYENDIWYGPIRKRYTALEQSLKKNSDDMQMVVNTIKGLANLYTDDRMDNEYQSTAELRGKSKAIGDWDFDKFKKYVEDNKIHDRRGFPSIREAVTRLTADERLRNEQEDAYQRGLREGEMRARMGVMPRPASAAAAVNAGQPAPSTIDEALSPESIGQDDELMRMLADLSTHGADLITGSK